MLMTPKLTMSCLLYTSLVLGSLLGLTPTAGLIHFFLMLRLFLLGGTAPEFLVRSCLQWFISRIGSDGLFIVVIGGSLNAGQVNHLTVRSGSILNHTGGHRLLMPRRITRAFDCLRGEDVYKRQVS